jgi:hypothetical protein
MALMRLLLIHWCIHKRKADYKQTDPHQLHNLLSTDDKANQTSHAILGISLPKVVARLDSLLLVLKSCKGQVCVKPWKALHPLGEVTSLEDALDTRYDYFYEEEQTNRVYFDECARGYLLDVEGPQFNFESNSEGNSFIRDGLPWYEWV